LSSLLRAASPHRISSPHLLTASPQGFWTVSQLERGGADGKQLEKKLYR
jgi:hypothetical protein